MKSARIESAVLDGIKRVGLVNGAILFLFFFLFFLKGFSLDPDFGWHIRTGQYILQHGVPQHDPFSYSMPSYPLLDHEWLTDILTAIVFRYAGMAGMAFLFAAVGIASLVLLIPKQKKIFVTPLLLSAVSLLFVFGVRPQVFSWFCFSLLLVILSKKNRKSYLFLPVLFLLWANVHASFPLGLGILFIYFLPELVEGLRIFAPSTPPLSGIRSGNKYIISGYFTLCFLATVVNPYGFRMWQEVFITLAQPDKYQVLTDWYPGIFVPYLPLWTLVFLSCFFLIRYRSHYQFVEKCVFITLLLIGMGAVVDTPYLALFSLPLAMRGFHFVTGSNRGFLQSKTFLSLVVFIIVIQGIPLFHQYEYPKSAVSYLSTHLPKENMFTDFNWGGYLLWQLPQRKVFIDGQMSNWEQSKQKGESDNALQEYLAVTAGRERLGFFTSKYHINTVLLPSSIQSSPVIKELRNEKWKVVYKDQIAVIYSKM